ncbi:sulfatase family protein [Brachybacterium tyrofermentans]|uniref:sulfatase family protein n=1 Tax=Brachybacterium tyrofermentans TaxID=47848 RepID=UPI003FCF014F
MTPFESAVRGSLEGSHGDRVLVRDDHGATALHHYAGLNSNIVFILTDDHAAHAISAYSGRLNSTPNLDRIAAQGARLDSLYCTNSICTPSRATILSGTYSHVNGAATIYSGFDYRVRTFPQVLHDCGYRTSLFGKWHLGHEERNDPQGFDEWRIYRGQGEYNDPVMYGIDADGERVDAVVPGYATDTVTDLALDWLDRTQAEDPESPFCLLLHHKAPHRNWIPHPRHADLYPLETIPEPDTLFDDHATMSRAVREVRMSIADDLTENDLKQPLPPELQGEENREARTRRNYQIYMRDYLQTIQAIDDSTGRVLAELESRGLAENTIVVYTSDQGFFLGDHGWFDKRLMFDQSLQMPMMVRWPATIPAGTVVDELATNVDLAATLLDACGIDPEETLPDQQGRSLLPLLDGMADDTMRATWPDAMYYRYWEHEDPSHDAPAHYGIRTATHKLIHYYGDGMGAPGSSDAIREAEWEMYDLVADPAELTNIVDDPSHAGTRAELERRLAALQDQVGDRPYEGPDTPRPEWGR